ncbi:unnamed protein product, partial [Symbiodinium sp. CCMP2456]
RDACRDILRRSTGSGSKTTRTSSASQTSPSWSKVRCPCSTNMKNVQMPPSPSLTTS